MKLNRIHVSEDSRKKLSILKRRTGLLPNVLCRLGLSLSLILESSMPRTEDYPIPEDYPIDGPEFNCYILIEEWHPLIVALLKERCVADGLTSDDESLIEQFCAHLNRGIESLYARVRGVSDLAGLLPKSCQTF